MARRMGLVGDTVLAAGSPRQAGSSAGGEIMGRVRGVTAAFRRVGSPALLAHPTAQAARLAILARQIASPGAGLAPALRT